MIKISSFFLSFSLLGPLQSHAAVTITGANSNVDVFVVGTGGVRKTTVSTTTGPFTASLQDTATSGSGTLTAMASQTSNSSLLNGILTISASGESNTSTTGSPNVSTDYVNASDGFRSFSLDAPATYRFQASVTWTAGINPSFFRLLTGSGGQIEAVDQNQSLDTTGILPAGNYTVTFRSEARGRGTYDGAVTITPIPEPSALSFLAVGASLALRRRAR